MSISQNSNQVINDCNLEVITAENTEVYLNLATLYEAEFSSLTNKLPNECGIFEPDSMPIAPYTGYLLYSKNIPIGFCIVEIDKIKNDVAEFYIVPAMRKKKYGYCMAAAIFKNHPGYWQVRQIEGANNAKRFWRKVIGQYTENNYLEDIVEDKAWGIVTRQRFVSGKKIIQEGIELKNAEKIIFENFRDKRVNNNPIMGPPS